MKNLHDKNLAEVITELHKAFDCLNKAFFRGTLPSVIITIQSKGKRDALGWFSTGKVWDDGTQEKHEINISAEYVNRDFMEIMRTLLHEMIHLFCCVNNIKDTSRGGSYHNKNFKAVSENHGMYYSDDAFDKRVGWSFCKLTDESKEIIKGFGIDEGVFSLKRYDFSAQKNEEKKKTNIIKWQCPCGNIVRSSKPNLKLICGDCMQPFEMQE